MTSGMQISTTKEGGTHVVSVRGEVDMESSPELLAELQKSIHDGHPVAVDLGAVRYMDSAGIAVLVGGLKAAMKGGTQLRVRNPSPQVVAVLRLANLLELFHVAEPEAGA